MKYSGLMIIETAAQPTREILRKSSASRNSLPACLAHGATLCREFLFALRSDQAVKADRWPVPVSCRRRLRQ